MSRKTNKKFSNWSMTVLSYLYGHPVGFKHKEIDIQEKFGLCANTWNKLKVEMLNLNLVSFERHKSIKYVLVNGRGYFKDEHDQLSVER